jgi:hypothetical protein
MKKATLSITDKHITIPLELIGIPTMEESWIARADLLIKNDNFVITIYRKSFRFDNPSKIYEAESVAKLGFKKGDYEVKRVMKFRVFPHIKANFTRLLPTGDFDFTVENRDNIIVLSLDISSFPKDQDKIKDVKNMLVG